MIRIIKEHCNKIILMCYWYIIQWKNSRKRIMTLIIMMKIMDHWSTISPRIHPFFNTDPFLKAPLNLFCFFSRISVQSSDFILASWQDSERRKCVSTISEEEIMMMMEKINMMITDSFCFHFSRQHNWKQIHSNSHVFLSISILLHWFPFNFLDRISLNLPLIEFKWKVIMLVRTSFLFSTLQ